MKIKTAVNKLITVNFSATPEALQALLPDCMTVRRPSLSSNGIISLQAGDFFVSHLGPLRIPPIHIQRIVCGIQVDLHTPAKVYPSLYPLFESVSSRLWHRLEPREILRNESPPVFMIDDPGEFYTITCQARHSPCSGYLSTDMKSVRLSKPSESVFPDAKAAAKFTLEHNGLCLYDPLRRQAFLQTVDHPDWEICFCHSVEHHFPHLYDFFREHQINTVLDSTLLVEEESLIWHSYRSLVPLAKSGDASRTEGILLAESAEQEGGGHV